MGWHIEVIACLSTLVGAHADSTEALSRAGTEVVRTMDSITVVASRFSDPRSIETVQHLAPSSIRRLAVDRLVDAVGLQAGVVVIGEDLHVRGGRAGELATSLAGISLNEPRRGTPMEVPLFAIRSADLLTGGLDADHEGSLAGELDLETERPTAQPEALVRWTGDAHTGSGYDALHARVTAPIARTGLGIALAGEARLDDLGLPVTRSRGTTEVLGTKFGWRQDNHLLAWAKLAPVSGPQRTSLELLASRVVRQPYNPMFDFDGWVSFVPDSALRGELYSGRPLGTANRQLDETYFRYRAGDHFAMSDERRLAVIATLAGGGASASQRLALGWSRVSELTSVGLRHDPSYVNQYNRPSFGPEDYAWGDPFHSYAGDEPYFRDSGSQTWFARVDASRTFARRHRVRFGAGVQYENVRLFEIDQSEPVIYGVDSLRAYNAFAPGAFAYVQHRWDYGGLTWNAGLRVSSFTAGPQARGPYVLPLQHTGAPYHAPTIWSWSPRLGFAYPVSDRDAFSLSYSRIFQDPPRDLLYDDRKLIYDRHPYGNGTMVPAEVISYQAALKHILDPRWSFQLAVFYRDVYAQPGARVGEPALGYYVLEYQSADDGHASGFELTLTREERGRGRFELSYTYMNAWGTQSSLEGLAYGTNRGWRPVPTGTHPLDWDERHAIAASLLTESWRGLSLSWSTRVASGLPWTPLYAVPGNSSEYPPAYSDELTLNSARLPWNENTNVALRYGSRYLGRFTAMLSVTNLFANHTDRLATISGYPNPVINTLYDEYGAYRTQTGLGGGAYWNDPDGDGVRQWVPVGDHRLAAPPRAIRLGVEVAL